MLKNKSTAVGLVAYLALVLAGPALKLTHVGPVAHWSWWWATVLLWGPWALVVLATVVVVLFAACSPRISDRPPPPYDKHYGTP